MFLLVHLYLVASSFLCFDHDGVLILNYLGWEGRIQYLDSARPRPAVMTERWVGADVM